jgi:hypothetical protein
MVRSVRARHVAALVLTLAAAMLVVTSVPATAAPVRFGSRLTTTMFPNEAGGGRTCDSVLTGGNDDYPCTWMEDQAKNAPSDPSCSGTGTCGFVYARAPKDGHINKIRLISNVAGSFRLLLGRYKPSTQEGRITRVGPPISYVDGCGNTSCTIQVISIDPLLVKKGEVLAFNARRTGTLGCGTGSDHISLYEPRLVVGGPLTAADDTDGCYALLEAQYQ